MDVRSALEQTRNAAPVALASEQEVTGWLVIIGEDLYLLEENLHQDYRQSLKIRLTDPSIKYAIRQSIVPLGGGESFVFHRAKILGLLCTEPVPELTVKRLSLQERGQEGMIAVDITPAAIDAGKARYEEALSFDFFKEMGDK